MNELSPLQLILNASAAVQFVMLTLLLLSVVSWVMIAQRWLVLSAAKSGFGMPAKPGESERLITITVLALSTSRMAHRGHSAMR